MKYIMHSKPNDCSVCAVINALVSLGISVNKDDVEIATHYNNGSGGFPDIGLKIISDKLNLHNEYYPKYSDIIWVNHPSKKGVETASELNKERLFPKFKDKLREGWVAVTTQRWEDTDDFHTVALIGIEDEKIKICCSLKGVYLADQDCLFMNKRGKLNGLTNTFWVRNADR